MFYVHPYLGKIFNLTNIFQRGWNDQLEDPLYIDIIYIDFGISTWMIIRGRTATWWSDHPHLQAMFMAIWLLITYKSWDDPRSSCWFQTKTCVYIPAMDLCMIQFDDCAYFFKWVETQPPTSYLSTAYLSSISSHQKCTQLVPHKVVPCGCEWLQVGGPSSSCEWSEIEDHRIRLHLRNDSSPFSLWFGEFLRVFTVFSQWRPRLGIRHSSSCQQKQGTEAWRGAEDIPLPVQDELVGSWECVGCWRQSQDGDWFSARHNLAEVQSSS